MVKIDNSTIGVNNNYKRYKENNHFKREKKTAY